MNGKYLCLTPRQGSSRPRFLACMSLLLSAGVPRNRWDSRTQAGLSHLWQTSIPSGISPLSNSQARRCVPTMLGPAFSLP